MLHPVHLHAWYLTCKTDKSNRSQSPVQRPYRQWIPFPDRYLEHQYLRTGCNTFRTKLKAGQEPGSLCQPTFIIGEFGGIVWETSRTKEDTWGHGGTFTNEDAFERIEKLINAIQSSGIISGFCYTQFSDIEQEKTVSTLTTGSLNLIWNGLDLSLKRFQADR